MPKQPYIPATSPNHSGPRSQLGLYRAHLTSPEHRAHITVGRQALFADTLALLRTNIGRKPKHHQLFIAPRGGGKTHFLSLIEDAIRREPDLAKAYLVVRFPEEARRVLSFADFLLTVSEVLKDSSPSDSPWHALHDRLATEEDDTVIVEAMTTAIRRHYRDHHQVLVLMVENLNLLMEEQMKQKTSVQALRGFLMQDNGCLLIATSPLHFGAIAKADQPFYDFFDIQVLDPLGPDDTIDLIRRNLEWDQRQDLLAQFPALQPKLRAIHTLTGGTPRLIVMLYELLSTESITAVKQQFLMLLDRITPFYQDRLGDLSPQERAVLETIASMRSQWGQETPLKTPANIAKLMRMKQSHVSSLLARLTKDLYLTASENPADKRSVLYTIREGFFDLWLAMNISRAARQRIPLLTDFFASIYEQNEERQQKRQQYWEDLQAGKFNEDSAETLSYLSEVGSPEERAAEKLRLATALTKRGENERPELLKRELQMLQLDSTGRWLCDHIEPAQPEYLDDLLELIQCWETRRQKGIEAFVQRLHEMGEKLDYHNWSTLHMEFLRDHLITMPLERKRVETRLRLAIFQRKFARWTEAEQQMQKALNEAEELKNNELISWACNECALLLQDINRLTEAELLMRRALAIDEQSFGEGHPNIATALNNLAQLLAETNRLAEAEQLMRYALTIDERHFGPNHHNVAIRLNNLALLFHTTNRLTEAEPLMRHALEINERDLGPDHSTVATSLSNLAALLKDTNRLAEAEPLMRRALAIDEQKFGSNHYKVAKDLNSLAMLLQNTNRLVEAEPLMQRALAIDEQSFGLNHPSVARDLNNLAALLQATNRLVEAEPLIRRTLDIAKKSFGPDHPKIAICLNNLAQLLQDTNRIDEAESLMRQALAIDEQSFGADHPNVARNLNNLGSLLQDTNRLAEAEPLMRRALAINEQSFGQDHPNVANSLNNLASMLQNTNRLVEAESLMRRALAIYEQSFGLDHPQTAKALNILALLLKDTNRLEEAESMMRRALSINMQSLGPNHPNVATILYNLVLLFQVTNRKKEAEPLMRQAAEILLNFFVTTGCFHPHLKTVLENYSRLLAEVGHTEAQVKKEISALLAAHGVSMIDRGEKNPAAPQG